MKLIHKDNFKNYIIGLLSLIISIIAYPKLPDQIPTHFNAQGVVDAYGSPLTIFLMPGIMLGMCVMAELLKNMDPKKASYSVFSKHYYLFFFVMNMFFFLINLYIISYSLELVTFNVTNIVIVLMGILFIFVGNMMPKIKQNYFMGIKTPWTIANDQVWYDTHRFGGKVWFAMGIVLCICAFLPSGVMVPVILAIALIGAFAPMIYSYLSFKKVNKEE